MKRILFIVFLWVFMCGCTHEIVPSFPNNNIGNFEALWKIIDEKYCFLDEKNINWDSIHSVYENKVKSLEENDYRSLFNLMGEKIDFSKMQRLGKEQIKEKLDIVFKDSSKQINIIDDTVDRFSGDNVPTYVFDSNEVKNEK
mgnify:CR=1 FL=1